MHFDVIRFYENIRSKTVNLPDWNQLNPHHQHQVVQACNLLLSVMYENNVQGKEQPEND